MELHQKQLNFIQKLRQFYRNANEKLKKQHLRASQQWITDKCFQQLKKANYRQFSRRKQNKYKHQFPRMRGSELIHKIMRQWQAMSNQEQTCYKFKYGDGQDDISTSHLRLFFRQITSTESQQDQFERQRQRQYQIQQQQKRKKKIAKQIDPPKSPKSPKVRVFQGQAKVVEGFQMLKDYDEDIRHQMQHEQLQQIMAMRAQQISQQSYQLRLKKIFSVKSGRNYVRKNSHRPKQTIYDWSDWFYGKFPCYFCWKMISTKTHVCLRKFQLLKKTPSNLPKGFILIGSDGKKRKSFDISALKWVTDPKSKQQGPQLYCMPATLIQTTNTTQIKVNYFVKKQNNVRGREFVQQIRTFPSQFAEKAKQFPLLSTDEAEIIIVRIPQYDIELLKEPQVICMTKKINNGQIFGPLGGDIIPKNIIKQAIEVVKGQFDIYPLTGATLMSFLKHQPSGNCVVVLGTIKQKVYVFLKAIKDINDGQQIVIQQQ